MNDRAQHLQDSVLEAVEAGVRLHVIGGDSKAFYGRDPCGRPLSVASHSGIVDYQPSELVVTVRAGTPLANLESLLAEHQQTLACEPPHFGAAATVGGAVAAGLSGPARPFTGALRDFVLGCKILNGKGEILSFGGQVMKNVAGYDVSRLLAGSMGTLGIILEVSFKVLPGPATQMTLCFEMDRHASLRVMNQWAGRPLPLSALCFDGERVHLRLSGSPRAVDEARRALGGEPVSEGAAYWQALREHQLPFFDSEMNLWRISLAPATPALPLEGHWFYDWAGAQRWLLSEESAPRVFEAAAEVGGHATLFRGKDPTGEVFQPLSDKHMAVHQDLKRAFDPAGILNIGRLYPDL